MGCNIKQIFIAVLEIPNAAVLFLRSTGGTPDSMEIELKTPGGDVGFPVSVIKLKNYTIDQIFEKKLYFLIPFYLFNRESEFKKINADPEKIEKLKAEYKSIVERLDEAVQNENLTVYAGKTIFEMTGKVTEALAAKYSNIKEGVKTVMGGKVLDYEAKRILNQGRAEGRAEGRIEGELNTKIKSAKKMFAEGMKTDAIARILEATEDSVISWIGMKTA